MVGGLPISPEAAQVAVEEAGERPYEQARTRGRRHHGIRLSQQFLQKLTQRVGEFCLPVARGGIGTTERPPEA